MTKSLLKKISAFLAMCMLAGCLTGCGGNDTASGTAESTAESTVEAEEEKEIIKVGYIYNGSCDIDGFSAEVNAQRLAIGAYTDIQSCYIDNVNITDLSKAVEALAKDGCTYIVTGSNLFANAVSQVAGKNMNLNFISYGARVRSVNVYAYTDRIYEGAYVAGMAAAFNSKTEKVGIVVDTDMLYSKAVVNAVTLGAQLVFNDAETVVAFAAADSEIHSAVDALQAENCDVIISYTESNETVSYCDSKGIKVIGSLDYSKTAENYKNMIMYFNTKHDSFYLAMNKMMQLKTWEPSAYVGTLANGVVNVSDALPAAVDGTQDIISALVPKLASGEAYVFTGEIKNTSGNVMLQRGSELAPEEIYGMEWYVKGVRTLPSFIEPNLELEENEFTIKY